MWYKEEGADPVEESHPLSRLACPKLLLTEGSLDRSVLKG